MEDCFSDIENKVNYGIINTNLEEMFSKLSSIKTPTIVTGLGGSSIVATFLAKLLREKNKIISTFHFPRDLQYMSLNNYDNVICVSYSANNIGLDMSFNNNLNKYLFTGNPKQDINNIVYKMLPEISYVSINATLVPLSLLFLYYCNDKDLLFEILGCDIEYDSTNNQFEILTGQETITASTMFESCITESGIGTCVVHDKYNYCHGRINITKNTDADMILMDSHNELDELYRNTLNHYYNKVLILDRKYDDDVINDFYLTVLCLKLVRQIALNKHIDISDMDELPDNDMYYRFNGKIK